MNTLSRLEREAYERGYYDALWGGMAMGFSLAVILYIAWRFGAAFAGGHPW